MNRFKGESALLLTTLIWGATFAIIKSALVSVSPMVFLSFRFIIATLIIFPIAYPQLKKVSRQGWIDGIILGLLYFGGFASQTLGLKYTTATKSGFITGTFVMFTPFFQYWFEKKLPGKGNVIGIGLIVVGMIFLSTKGNTAFSLFTQIGSDFNIGDFLTLLCAVSYAVYIVHLDIVSKRNDYMPLVFMQVAVTAIGAVVFGILFWGTGLQQPELNFTKDFIIAVAYTSLLATVITTTLQTKFQKYVTPAKAAIIFSLEPIFSAVAAYFMLNERISNFGLVGSLLIFSGLLFSELYDRNQG
ncbi:MAG: DMT family transporter [Methanococcaceae archaeon]